MLERQIMFKKMKELQRQKKLQELNVTRQQNVVNQLSFTHNKQSSGLLNNGIPVRDKSQMFMFDRTNLVHGLTNQTKVLQSMGLASRFQGPSNESAGMLNFSKPFVVDQFNDSSNEDSATLDPLEQNILFDSCSGAERFGNMFVKTDNSSDISSLQNGSWSDLMQSAVAQASSIGSGQQEEWNGLSFQNPNVPKSETDDAFIPSYSNSHRSPYFGFSLTTSSQSQSQRPHVNYYDSSQLATPSYSGSRELVFNSDSSRKTSNLVSVKKEDGQQRSTTLKQPDATPHNSSSTRAAIKKECVNDDHKIPQVTSLSQRNFAFGNYKSQPINQTIKRSSNQYTTVLKSKKRKFATLERIPWNKEVTEGCPWLHDIRTAELEWAQSACRLPDQLNDLGKEVTNSLWMVNRKRRLNLTTQLMQLLFRPAPATVLSKDVTQHYDHVTYYAAKLAIGDACSLCSNSAVKMTYKSSRDQDLSKTVKGLIDRSKRLEHEFSRLVEKGELSILDVKMDFQNLVKVSVINRFATFHTRGPPSSDDAAESSSVQKLYPQKYVKARAMPNTVPEERHCLSL